MKKILFLMALFVSSSLFPFFIVLQNDGPFILTAVVQGNNGITVATETFNPQEKKKIWIDTAKSQLKNSRTPSYTPFTVIWKCPKGGVYSTNYGIMPGQTVLASSGMGSFYCEIPSSGTPPSSNPKEK